jgi:lipopolysaccharide biosynthesis glycosyltransferase
MLSSVVANLDPRRTLKVYVVDSGLDAGTRSRISASVGERVTLHWIAPERSGFVDLPLWGRMTIATYDKLTIGQWLPESEGRVLWLDCDLLALTDLARLWETGLGESGVLATQDLFVRTLGARFGVACHRELGINPDAEYFNAGIMLIDVARWRSDDIAARALTYLRRYRRQVYFWDQEALNATLVGRWSKLDQRWNWSPRFARIDFDGVDFGHAEKSPWIVHFSGGLKPWHFEGKSAPFELYYRYLDSTAWAGWRPARNWKNMALSHYESSRFRNLLSPFEKMAMAFQRAMTLHYVSATQSQVRIMQERPSADDLTA